MQGDDFEYLSMETDTVSFYIRAEHYARYVYAGEQFRKRRARQVLDISCGSGYGSNVLKQYTDQVTAVDRHLLRPTSLMDSIQYYTCDLHQPDQLLSHFPKPIDGIACMETLEHVENPQNVLRAFSSLLRKKGILALSIPNGQYESRDANGHLKNPYHLHAFTRDEITTMLKDCGFYIYRQLYQSVSAQIFRNQTRAIRDMKLSAQDAHRLEPSIQHLEYYARLYAWPEETPGPSYTMMLMCEKQ